MKGIAHFITGVASATFFPWSIQAAEQGNPMYFILGGAFGILPDTLDFKFYRYFYHHDEEIQPDPLAPDPQRIAECLAAAIDKAYDKPEGYRLKLNTIRLGADYWQQYKVIFDPEKSEVVVEFGPVVNTGQVPVPGTTPEKPFIGRASLNKPIDQTYDAITTVDIFDGPSFLLRKEEAAEQVSILFLPWHRSWTHSYVVGIGFGLLFWLLWGVLALLFQYGSVGFREGWKVLSIIAVGFAGHLIEDQLGFMGSNLFYPLTKNRMKGMHIMRSGDALPNFLTVWICCLIIFWNLYAAIENPLYEFNLLHVMLYGGLLPIGVFLLLMKLTKRLNRCKQVEREVVDTSKEWGDNLLS